MLTSSHDLLAAPRRPEDHSRDGVDKEEGTNDDGRQEGKRDVENGRFCPRECHTGGVAFEGCPGLISAGNPRTALAVKYDNIRANKFQTLSEAFPFFELSNYKDKFYS